MAKFKLQLIQVDDGTPDAKAATVKALSRQLRITALTLLLATGMIIAVTVAWFAMNRDVDSTGMQMEVKTTSNLVIVPVSINDVAVTGAKLISNAAADDHTATFPDPNDVDQLIPATHNATVGTVTGLAYVTDPGSISQTTGYLKNGNVTGDANYSAVPLYVSGDRYYLDYRVHIAYDGDVNETFTAASLTADFTSVPAVSTVSDAEKDYQKAASVDFYLVTPGATQSDPETYTYKGTLNLAGLDYSANDTSTPATAATLISGPTTIPHKASGSPITVVMRFYFDGNLKKTEAVADPAAPAKAYVNSAAIAIGNMPAMTVTFHAVKPST